MSDPLQRALAALIRQGASEDDLEAYTAEYEHAHRFKDPALPAMTGTGEKVLPAAPKKSSTAEKLVGGAESFLTAVNPFQDELTGGVAALIPGGQGYTEARDQSRARTKAFKRENPKTGLALDIAGAVTPAVASGGATVAARGLGKVPLSQLVKQGAQMGATAGGIYGFGNAEGTIGEQANQTAMGALVGGAVGGAVPAAGRGIAKGTRKLADVFGRTTPKGRTDKLASTLDSELSASGQTVDDALGRVDDLRTAGVQDVSTADAIGPAGPRVVDKMRSGLSTERGASGVSPAGKASQFADELDDAVGKAKQGLEARTGPKATALYDEARKVGGVEITDPSAQRALQYFEEQFPGAEKQVMDKFQRLIHDGKLTFDDVIDPQSGNYTVTYWDEVKKFFDGQVRARKSQPDLSWARANAREATERLDDLVNGIDDAINLRTGKAPYAEARAQAGKDIGARKALTEQRGETAKSLHAASKRTGRASDPETSVAQFGAGRGKIGLADLLMDLLKSGVRKSGQEQAETTLTALTNRDPEALLTGLLSRQSGARNAALRRAGKAGAVAGYGGNALQRALEDR